MGDFDEVDMYGTLTLEEAAKLGVLPSEQMPIVYAEDSTGSVRRVSEKVDK